MTESVGEDPAFASPFGCCIQEVLLCCHPVLSEECIAARLSLVQRLESILHILSTATDGPGRHGNQDLRQAQPHSPLFCFCHLPDCSVGSALPALLVEQASLKQSELDAHPVRSNMKQLLRSLDQLSPFEPDGGLARPDYVRSFLDYINTLASVVVRSLDSEGKNSIFLLDLNVIDYLLFIFLAGS